MGLLKPRKLSGIRVESGTSRRGADGIRDGLVMMCNRAILMGGSRASRINPKVSMKEEISNSDTVPKVSTRITADILLRDITLKPWRRS